MPEGSTSAGTVDLSMKLNDTGFMEQVQNLSLKAAAEMEKAFSQSFKLAPTNFDLSSITKKFQGFASEAMKSLDIMSDNMTSALESGLSKISGLVEKSISAGTMRGFKSLSNIKMPKLDIKMSSQDYKNALDLTIRQMDELNAKIAEVQKDGYSRKLYQMMEQTEQLAIKARGLEEAYNNAMKSEEIAKAADKMGELAAQTERAARSGKKFSFVGQILSGMNKTLELTGRGLRNIASYGKRAVSAISSGLKNAASHMLHFGRNTDRAHSGLRKLLRIGVALFGLRSIFSAFRRVMGDVKDSIASAGKQFISFGNSMNIAKRNAMQLKGAFASMFIPLINIALPIINRVTAALTRMFNAIATFIARITGQKAVLLSIGGITEADAAGMNEAAKATEKNRKEKEKLKRQLASFDELNILSFDKNNEDEEDEPENGGDLGGGMVESGPVYQEVAVEPLIITDWMKFGRKLAQKINDAIDKIDAVAIGHKIGNVVQRSFEFAYGFLDTLKYNRLGNKVATILNTAFGDINFVLIGRTFGAGINVIFRTGLDFVSTFKWRLFGRKIADAIFGFLSEIEWNTIANTFSKYLNGLIDAGLALVTRYNWSQFAEEIFLAINKFIQDVNWDQLGKLIAKSFNAVIDWIYTAIRTFDWEKTARSLGRSFMSFIRNVEWENVGRTISAGFKKAIEFFKTLLTEINWQEIGNKIGTMIKNIDWISVFYGIGDILWEAIKAVVGLGGGMVNGLSKNDASRGAVKLPFYNAIGSGRAFARGGIVEQPTLSLMGEAGKEAIVPLENNTEWIDRIAAKMAEASGAGSGTMNVTIPIYLSEGNILDVIRVAFDREGRLLNKPVFNS